MRNNGGRRCACLALALVVPFVASGCASLVKVVRPDFAPALGAMAPNFTLKTLKGEREVELAAFRGVKPVVLVLGSYT